MASVNSTSETLRSRLDEWAVVERWPRGNCEGKGKGRRRGAAPITYLRCACVRCQKTEQRRPQGLSDVPEKSTRKCPAHRQAILQGNEKTYQPKVAGMHCCHRCSVVRACGCGAHRAVRLTPHNKGSLGREPRTIAQRGGGGGTAIAGSIQVPRSDVRQVRPSL